MSGARTEVSPWKWIDAHCHLADPRIAGELDRMVQDAEAEGIGTFIQGGVGPEDWERQLGLKKRFPGKIITAFGIHPWWVAAHSREENQAALKQLESRLAEADALGEIGLDHGPRCASETRALQGELFKSQLELARGRTQPLVLHVVRAHGEVLEVLRSVGHDSVSGLVHSFSGSKEVARQYLDLGLHLSISGAVTRKGFETLKRAVSYIPGDRLLLETDAPDQMPEGWSGEWNEPAALRRTAEAVGIIRGEDPGKLLETSTANARKLFGIEKEDE